MASATTKPNFSFHHLYKLPSSSSSSSSSCKPPLISLRPPPTYHFIHGSKRLTISLQNYHFAPRSIDVSKEDTPLPSSDQEPPPTPPPAATAAEEGSLPVQETENLDQDKIDKRRLEEKFAVLNTGIYECRSCGYKYDEAVGDPSYPIPAGFQFEKLPEDWRCPTCGAAKSFFVSKMVEIAGFAQNQQYGFGGNTLTSGQKAALIYGSLFFFFLLFLSGYFLQ